MIAHASASREDIANGDGRPVPRLTIVSATENYGSDLECRLGRRFDIEQFAPSALPASAPGDFALIDVDLRDKERVADLREWLRRGSSNGQIAVCVDPRCTADTVQAFALGATCVVNRPIDCDAIAQGLSSGHGSICPQSAELSEVFEEVISAGIGALSHTFAAASAGKSPDIGTIETASEEVVVQIEKEGLQRWLQAVRNHHGQTFQHCLIVTAIAVAFGQHLGFSKSDQPRLAQAGLLHDVGKAHIPIAILEKPGPLDEQEMAIIRTHPVLGYEALRGTRGLHAEMLDVTRHHHEYLDGTGYPDGLSGDEISDLVRTITIADIFGALIERRSYKPPMTGDDAYQVLVDMGSKLDTHLVRAFAPVAKTVA
jgi:putative nucleotidyltransferase with HDIG domain